MKSKSRGIFPGRGAAPNRRDRGKGGGSAGNSSGGSGNRQGGDGYKLGMLGWRSSRQAGGQSIAQKQVDRPEPTDKSLTGVGGLAWDKSAAAAMEEPRYPPPTSRK